MLATPFAFNETGEYLGILTVPFISFIISYSMYLLVKVFLLILFYFTSHIQQCKHEANRQITGDKFNGPIVTFLDLAKTAHPIVEKITLFSLVVLQLCICTGWVVVIMDNVSYMMPDFLEPVKKFPIVWVFKCSNKLLHHFSLNRFSHCCYCFHTCAT